MRVRGCRNTPGSETQAPTVNNVHRPRYGEQEFGVLQELAISEYLTLDRQREQISTNEDVPIVQEPDVSPMGETGDIEELFRAISENAPKSENGQKLLLGEFKEAMGRISRRIE